MKRFPTQVAMACIGLFTLGLECQAQQPNWHQLNPKVSPSARVLAAAACDTARKKVVLFGGIGGTWLADTWEWNGMNWREAKPTTSPPAREDGVMVFDSARSETVLFGGGKASTLHADTWTWDGRNWTHKSTLKMFPPARKYHAMAYDAARERVVLFGGYDGKNYVDDTWEWNGKTWATIKRTVSPTARLGHAMAYDGSRQRTVLFGGSPLTGGGETWEWDGKAWVHIKPTTSPSARAYHEMTYDPVRRRVLLFGGYASSNSPSFGDTWEWDGQTWTKINAAQSPANRYMHSMAYDAARKGVLVFAGYSSRHENDTWLYQIPPSVTGTFTPFGKGCGPAPIMTLAAATGSRPVIGTAFVTVTTGLPREARSVLMCYGVSNKYMNGFPILPLDLSPFGFKGCFLYHSFDAAWTVPTANGEARFSAPVPNDPRLISAKFYVQAAAGFVTSNAGEVLIGNQ